MRSTATFPLVVLFVWAPITAITTMWPTWVKESNQVSINDIAKIKTLLQISATCCRVEAPYKGRNGLLYRWSGVSVR